MNEPEVPAARETVSRWKVLRDAVVFQVKLILDGMLDFFMVPISIVGAVISFFTGRPTFYDFIQSGHVMDRRIDLFRVANRSDDEESEDRIERLARRLEEEIRREIAEGGLRASAKSSIDRIISTVRKREN